MKQTICLLFLLSTSSVFALDLKELGSVNYDKAYNEINNKRVIREKEKSLHEKRVQELRSRPGASASGLRAKQIPRQPLNDAPLDFDSETGSWRPSI